MGRYTLKYFNPPTKNPPFIPRRIVIEQIVICEQLGIPEEVMTDMWNSKTEASMHGVKLDYLRSDGRYKDNLLC